MSRRPATELHAEHEMERAYTRKLERHEQDVRHRERQRCALFLVAPYDVEDDAFPGCYWDAAPYPAPIHPEAA